MAEGGFEALGKRLGIWKVLVSPKALKSIQSLGRSGNFRHIEAKLRELAAGEWSFCLAGTDQQKRKLRVPLVTTRCNPPFVILWQIDVASDNEAQVESQLVKVWAIGAAMEMSKLIDGIILLQRSYSTEHVARCRRKPPEDSGKRFIPILFMDNQAVAKPGASAVVLDIRDVDREVFEMANRFYMLTEPLIRSVLANDPLAEFPLDLSGDEARIILHTSTSSLILGRSGTGKTTCLVFKLLAKYAAASALVEERAPRQLLLTRSNELAIKLKDYVKRLMRSLATSSFEQPEQQDGEILVPDSNEDDDQCDTIFDLQDSSFPLISTYDAFLELLENTIKRADQEGVPGEGEDNAQEKDQSDRSESSDDHPRWQPSPDSQISDFVDLQSFKLDYWPKFPPALVKNLASELVFAEILGVIKGSLSSRETLKPISREDYMRLSSRLAPSFTLESERSRVYALFESYQVLKLRRGELDGVDRVVKIIGAVRESQGLSNYLKTTFDDVYIDEVQDLRTLDLDLLLSIVNDSRAFQFAGDTAQAISQDSHFRFQDVKALFYDRFAPTASLVNQPEIARPQLFTLAKNYRSHQGILGLASLVMALLWNAFPETVDKLEPEVGQMHGPLPVFFLGCTARMLVSSDTSTSDQPKQSLEFGAEQAVIVRDQGTKAKLQAKLKETALVLTILESKGMEFEDVFLWNFFTDSPCPGGWRCLDALQRNLGEFDVKKYAGMCSELKHFYVAITRARYRLSIVESEATISAQVAEFLTHDLSSPLVEATKSSDANFLEELMSLRSISHDPQRWSDRGQELIQRKQFKDAAMCFRRAMDKRGETYATAFIFEEEGRRLVAIDKIKAAQPFFRSAVQKFRELDRTADAVRTLVKMGELSEAAMLWAEKGHSAKAAPLFAEAEMFADASEHYHQAHSYDKAADVLRLGGLADSLVTYVSSNRDKLSPRTFRNHSRYSLLLLKQEKIGPGCLEAAISLLGSHTEQEQAFIEYEMHDQLAELYMRHGQFKKRLLLFFRIGNLDRALSAINNLDAPSARTLSDVVQKVKEHYCAGWIITRQFDNVQIPAQLPSLDPEWVNALQLPNQTKHISVLEHTKNVKDEVVRAFLQLHAFLNLGLLSKTSTLDEFRLDIVEAATTLAVKLSLDLENTCDPVILLLTGVIKGDHNTKPFILLPWSPFHEDAANFVSQDFPKRANEWFLDKLGSAMLALDSTLRCLWKSRWPVRCAHFLTQGNCKGHVDRSCRYTHERVQESDCGKKMSTLVAINTVICSLTAIHRKAPVNGDFQRKFLGIRRHWLEHLLRELIFVSSFEHSSQIITEFQSLVLRSEQDARQNKGVLVLAASIEDLLFHRLGKEWRERNDTSSLFEQLQVSQILGHRVAEQFSRCLHTKLRYSGLEIQRYQVEALQDLETESRNAKAGIFLESVRRFTFQFRYASVAKYSSFHSITTIFEFFAAYLILMACRVALLIPQSWIDIHCPWFADTVVKLPARDLQTYASSLVELVLCYCQLLSQLDSLRNQGFRLDLPNYPSRLLHRRNAELLATVVINLELSHGRIEGLKEVRDRVCQILSLPHMRSSHLLHRGTPGFLKNLVNSYRCYDGKDCIKYVRKLNDTYAAHNTLRELGIRPVSFSEIVSAPSASRGVIHTPPPSTQTMGEQQGRRLEAVRVIQRFWRSRYPNIQERRRFLNTQTGRLHARILEICQQTSASPEMCHLLTRDGVKLLERVGSVSGTASDLQHQAVSLLICLPQEQFEHLDEVIKRVSCTDEPLETLAKEVGMERLEQLAGGECSEVQRLFQKVGVVLEGVSRSLDEAEEMLKLIQGKSTVGQRRSQ